MSTIPPTIRRLERWDMNGRSLAVVLHYNHSRKPYRLRFGDQSLSLSETEMDTLVKLLVSAQASRTLFPSDDDAADELPF